MTWQTKSTGSADTERLGGLLGKIITAPEIIELVSDLGGGKTTFVRGLARGLGSHDKVSSPTFTLNRIYKAGDLEIHHFDFYRLNEPGVVAAQLEESLQNPKAVTVIEWSDIVEDVLPAGRLTIQFQMVGGETDGRQIEIRYPESKIGLITQLETAWKEIEP